MKTKMLLDAWGRPVRKADLTQEVAGASTMGVRSPITGTPADGLNPTRLASILREAQDGEPVRYLELAEYIEERDLHYLGVLGTRRRSVAQIEITVEAGSEAPEDEERAERVRAWLKRDELAGEIFGILDCIGKGYSGTEIIWDSSTGQWEPTRLELRDPRSFRFDRETLSIPMLLGDGGQSVPLPGFKFIWANIQAKSGLQLRGGLARPAAWAYMFKKFTERDWAIFVQTYGHPVRVGKYGAGATEDEKRTLLRAVTNIAGDMAGIIPDSMAMEFIQSANVGSAHAMYLERCNWIDQQVSKMVLGQTATTDAVTGGLGSGKEHREVQKDIETADAKALAAILNRDLIRPWMDLEYGPLKVYPRLKIARPEEEDLKAFSDAVVPLVDRGLEVDADEVLAKFGLRAPKAGAKLLRPASSGAPPSLPPEPDREIKGNPGEIKRGAALPGMVAALNGTTALQSVSGAPDPVADLTDRLTDEAAPAMEAMVAQIEAMIGAAGSLEELRAMLLEGFPRIGGEQLAEVLGRAFVASLGAGMTASADESEP